jgi:hypothetical protein
MTNIQEFHGPNDKIPCQTSLSTNRSPRNFEKALPEATVVDTTLQEPLVSFFLFKDIQM